MSLWPRNRREWALLAMVIPLPVWLPFALLMLIGTQGSHGDVRPGMLGVAAVTLTLLLLAVLGAWRFGAKRPQGWGEWVLACIAAALVLVPAGLILYEAVRLAFRY
jgi:hypothetical protein